MPDFTTLQDLIAKVPREKWLVWQAGDGYTQIGPERYAFRVSVLHAAGDYPNADLAALIVEAHNQMPALLDELARLRRTLSEKTEIQDQTSGQTVDIDRLQRLRARATAGPLVLATSNSWRRIISKYGSKPVCEPCTQPDGHPDLHFPNGGTDGPDATLLIEAWNALPALVEEVTRLRALLARDAAPQAGAMDAQPAAVSAGVLAFDPGELHIEPDGSGSLVVPEASFTLEDDRCEGPDGPQGSGHWIARIPASEMAALRGFLNGQPESSLPAHKPDGGDAPWADWMGCESRRPFVMNSLRSNAEKLRSAERRTLNAYRQDYMGAPCQFIAATYGKAAALFEAQLAAIDAAISAQQRQQGK